ncbi:MAG: phosphatidylglycerophosphatase A [Planctomycetes bacterium]|nr:phosphatidylglycerophosphatase A [Planctomycetota bacterium]
MIREALITTFGLGKLRPAPGTWGSLPPAAIAWLMLLDGVSPAVYHWTLAAIAIVFGAACIAFGIWTQRRFGKKDPSQCVCDETCAQCLPLMFWPSAWFESCRLTSAEQFWGEPFWHATATVAAAFLAFRILDIIKPWPGRRLERLPYGWGVLADDLSSGLYAAIILQVATRTLA